MSTIKANTVCHILKAGSLPEQTFLEQDGLLILSYSNTFKVQTQKTINIQTIQLHKYLKIKKNQQTRFLEITIINTVYN